MLFLKSCFGWQVQHNIQLHRSWANFGQILLQAEVGQILLGLCPQNDVSSKVIIVHHGCQSKILYNLIRWPKIVCMVSWHFYHTLDGDCIFSEWWLYFLIIFSFIFPLGFNSSSRHHSQLLLILSDITPPHVEDSTSWIILACRRFLLY